MVEPVIGEEAVERWNVDGWCLLEGLLPSGGVGAALGDIGGMFPTAEDVASALSDPAREGSEQKGFDLRWDQAKPTFPFDGLALNLLTVHDRLIDLAEQLLGVERVQLYQGLVSAKYSSDMADHEQLLHADYGNHTLVVPRADRGYQQLLLFVYLSDVTEQTGATRMVSRRSTSQIPVERTYLRYDEYADLYAEEVPAVGPVGSVLAYRPDVFHRGTRLVAPGAARFLLHLAFKPVGTDWMGFHVWPVRGEDMAWHRLVPKASARQLTVLGFPEPGHPYWTAETLAGVSARYPKLDLSPWTAAPVAPTGPGHPHGAD
ncbi:MAG: phytanoyl-CoA dioxygenase family protein [Acidimicrobiales bacterium]